MEPLLKQHPGRCVRGKKGSCTQTPSGSVCAALDLSCVQNAKGLREGLCQDPIHAWKAHPGSRAQNWAPEALRGTCKLREGTDPGDQDCVWYVRSSRSPLGSRERRPSTGRVVKEERMGRCVDSLGRGPRVVTAGQHRGEEEGALVAGNAQKQGLDPVKNHT